MNSERTQPCIYMYPFPTPSKKKNKETPLPSGLPYNIEQSSMCCIVGLSWLSILNLAART